MGHRYLFEPFYIKNTRFRNRILAGPSLPRWFTAEGSPTEFDIAYFESKARGGASQVTIGDTPVSPRYRAQPKETVINLLDPACWAGVTELVLAIKRYGSVASIELSHTGSAAVPAYGDGSAPIGPSGFVREDGVEVLEMDEGMIQETIEAFGDNAAMAKKLGFDMCMVHAGHGWLLSQFLSRRTNRRRDRWGGSLENRARLAIAVIDQIRERCGPDFLIEVRISSEEFLECGITLEESLAFAKLIEDRIDLLHVSISNHNVPDVWEHGPTSHPLVPLGNNVENAAKFKRALKVPVAVACGITSPGQAEEILAAGKADFVAMIRALIADPELPNKAKRGLDGDIIPCIRCFNCLAHCEILRCSVNPETGNEQRRTVQPFQVPHRRVAIVGGGPAGMQAAITAAERGHQVTLFEKMDTLGGLLCVLEKESMKQEVRAYKDYLIRKVSRAAEVRLNTEVTADILERESYDVVFAAVGSRPIRPRIPGVEQANVLSVLDAYREDASIGEQVLILGGGDSGCETALDLAEKGKHVIIVEILDKLGAELNDTNPVFYLPILLRLRRHPNVEILTGARCEEIKQRQVKIMLAGGGIRRIPVDTVIYAVGMRPNHDAVDQLARSAPCFEAIGDCVRVGKIVDATMRGYFAAYNIR